MKTLRIFDQTIYFFFLAGLIFFDLLVLFNIPSILKTIVEVPFLCLTPGLLFLSVIKIPVENFWERLIYALGISIGFIMFCGFFANLIFPIIQISRPMTTYPLLYIINVFYCILLFPGYIRSKKLKKRFHIPKITLFPVISGLLLLLFPLLGIFSAIQVTNEGSSLYTPLLLIAISTTVIVITIFNQKINQNLYPFILFTISLSLLFMTSLRGWYVTGHDIQREFYVFQLTKSHGFWDINFYKDAYNSCLSITILPTVFSVFSQIPDSYIYKVIFQILFAFAPIIIYLFIKKVSSPILAFLSVFYFIAFPTFFNDMPMLNRQEIGFIYFFLLLYVLFHDRLTLRMKVLLGSIFGVGMVVSHYSTTYVAVALLIMSYFIRKLVSHRLPSLEEKFLKLPKISGAVLLIVVAFTLYWNSFLTKTSGDLVKTISGSLLSIQNGLAQDSKSSDVSYSIFFPHAQSTKDFINNFIDKSQVTAKQDRLSNFYFAATTQSFKPVVIPTGREPITFLGRILQKLHLDPFLFNSILRSLCAKGIQIIVFLGVIWLFYKKTKDKFPLDLAILSVTSVTFILLMVLLPTLSLNYGLLRLFEQLLIVLGLPAILGSIWLFQIPFKKQAVIWTAVVAVIFFLNVSGFLSHLTGGYYPQMNYANEGIYYDAYFVHKSEVVSSQWLSGVLPFGATVQSDSLAANRLIAFGNINAVNLIIPSLIQKSSYVYLSTTNVHRKSIISVDRMLYIQYPTAFLDNNKSLIYNNGSTKIYK